MKKKILSIMLSLAMMFTMMSFMTNVVSAGADSVYVSEASDFIDYLSSSTNRTVYLNGDITVNQDIHMNASSLTLDLNGYTLTMNSTIYLTEDYAGLTVQGNGTIVETSSTLFVVGDASQNYNSTLKITGGKFKSEAQTSLIEIDESQQGYKYNTGLIISNGEFETKTAPCISSLESGPVYITGGSFYASDANAIVLMDSDDEATIAANVSAYVDGYQYAKESDAVEKTLAYATLGTNHQVQVGMDSQFATINVKPYPGKDVYYGTTPGDGSKALIGKTFYITAGYADGWTFVGWASDSDYSMDCLESTNLTYAKEIPDSSSCTFYPIFAKTIENMDVTLSETAFTYDGTSQTPLVTIDGLREDIDFTVTYPEDTTNVGTKTITVTGTGDYTGTKELTYTISQAYFDKITLSATSYTYNGKVHYPTVKVYCGTTQLVKGVDYTTNTYTSNKKPGTYTIKATGIGNYKGSESATYKIVVKPTTLKTLTKLTKSFKVTWTKQTNTYISGYQIQYSTSSKFTSAKTVTVSSYKTTSKTIKSLKSKKKYYVRVRTYKTISGKKYYSAWSKYKTVTTK